MLALSMDAVWGAEQIMLPRLKVAPPVKEWGAQEVPVDGFHHLGIRDRNRARVRAARGQFVKAIAEGYIPPRSSGPAPEMTSHDVCVLNSSDQDAEARITVLFSDCDPVGPYRVTIRPCRTRHIRFNDLSDPEPIPHGTDFASVMESDAPIVVSTPGSIHPRRRTRC